jgi:hypothetical protein
MAEPTIDDTLKAVRSLLREGRTTEADVQLDALQEALRIEAEKQKDLKPPPGKRTLVELQIDFADTVCDLLGNPPRLINLLVEIKGEIEAHPEQ